MRYKTTYLATKNIQRTTWDIAQRNEVKYAEDNVLQLLSKEIYHIVQPPLRNLIVRAHKTARY